MKVFEYTKEVITHSLPYIKGNTLDLGAGTAKYKKLILEQATQYVAFDLAPGKHIDKVGDITNTGLDSNSFNTIICTQVFEHIPKPWAAVIEIHRLLKPGGVCIVTAPFMQPYHADPHDYYRYTTEGMKALFAERFNIIEVGPYTKLFMTFSEMIHHTLFSPYKKKKLGADRIIKLIFLLATWLDNFIKFGKVYGNVYIIASKN